MIRDVHQRRLYRRIFPDRLIHLHATASQSLPSTRGTPWVACKLGCILQYSFSYPTIKGHRSGSATASSPSCSSNLLCIRCVFCARWGACEPLQKKCPGASIYDHISMLFKLFHNIYHPSSAIMLRMYQKREPTVVTFHLVHWILLRKSLYIEQKILLRMVLCIYPSEDIIVYISKLFQEQ